MGARNLGGATVAVVVLGALALGGCDQGPGSCVVATAAISGALKPRWSQVLGHGMGGAMQVRGDGTLIVTGLGRGKLTAGGRVIANRLSIPFVLALDQDGNLLWERTFEGSWQPRAIAVDRAGSIYLVAQQSSQWGGDPWADVDLGQGPISGAALLAKFDSNGALLYGRAVDGFLAPMAGLADFIDLHVTMGGPGEVVVTGDFSGNGSSESRGFVARYDATEGSLLSSRVTPLGIFLTAAASDGAGGLLMAGTMNGTFDWGPTTLTHRAPAFARGNALAFYLDGANRAVWARLLSENTTVEAVAVEGYRGFLAGEFSGTLPLDGAAVSARGISDLMILAVDEVATPEATLNPLAIIPAGTERLAALAPDGAGGVMAFGDVHSFLDLGRIVAVPGSEFLLHLDAAGQRLAQAELPALWAARGFSVARDGGRSYAFGEFAGAINLGDDHPRIAPEVTFPPAMFVAAFGPGSASTTSVPCPPPPGALASAASYEFVSVAGIALAGDEIVMASQTEVTSIPTAGGTGRLLALSQKRVSGLAVWGDRVLWSNQGTLWGYGPGNDGSIVMMARAGGEETVLAAGRDGPLSVATDGNYAYWTEGGEVVNGTSVVLAGSVMAVPLRGGAPETVAKGFDWVGPIVAEEGFVVFAAGPRASAGQIVRFAKGLDEIVVLGLTEGRVSSLAVADGSVYWVEDPDAISSTAGMIRRVPLVGGSTVVLARQERTIPRELAVVDGQLYWLVDGSTLDASSIVRMPVEGGPVTTLETSRYIGALGVDHSQVVWTASDPMGRWVLRARSLASIQADLDRTARGRPSR